MGTKRRSYKKLLASKKGEVIKVDIEGGRSPQQGFIVMHPEALHGVDIVHDTQTYPWPFSDNSVTLFMAGYVIEHISRENKGFIKFMDEAWRCLKVGGQLMISTPYAGSTAFWSNPENVNGCTPQTFFYFDPMNPSGLYLKHRPKPWEIKKWSYAVDGNMEFLMAKRKEEK